MRRISVKAPLFNVIWIYIHQAKWLRRYYFVAGAIFIMLVLLFCFSLHMRTTLLHRHRWGSGIHFLIIFVAALLILRAILFLNEWKRYAGVKTLLNQIDPIIERVLIKDYAQVQDLAVEIAAALDSCDVMTSDDQLRLHQAERLAGRYRLDYEHYGLLITDGQGRTIFAGRSGRNELLGLCDG
jgi:hypothetical protein